MAVMYVIHDPADRAVVETALLKALPSLGYDRWISSAGPDWTPEAIQTCAAAIVVVSSKSRASGAVKREAKRGLELGQRLISFLIDGTDPDKVADGLGALPRVDVSDQVAALAKRVRDGLPNLPPVAGATADARVRADAGTLIDWNEETFSAYLKEALARHDFNRGERLMKGLALHLDDRSYPYPADHARTDLKALRAQRQFPLMERYGALVLGSDTNDLEVRKLYAQSLIERGRFDEAEPFLEKIVDDAPPDHGERFEALGLLGRSFKQRYVDNPTDPRASAWLRTAFEKYYEVYRDHPDKFWHGVNAATCMQRAVRDGLDWANENLAIEIAKNVLNDLDGLRAKGPLAVWDCASRVEAMIVLGYFDSASAALDEYLTHPGMQPFEVGSTFRQFDQVLQLAKIHDGHDIYDRLWRAVDRYRAGGVTSTPSQRATVGRVELLPILIRVSDPEWRREMPNFLISSKLGTIVSARATRSVIQELLKDQAVIAIEESRSVIDVATLECARGLPFINVQDDYPGPGGQTYKERGRHALIAFIDNGIDILHEAFTDENGKSRIVGIWDQRDSKGPSPKPFGYGRYYQADEIQDCVAKKMVPASLGQNTAGKLEIRGHGTHVASIAAGRKVDPFYGGIAPAARLLIVIAKSDGDIGYSNAHMDALAFIDAVATELEVPVVVNVSKGMNAGAHDGKSALEIAFDNFSGGGRRPGRVVVKSAGNERSARGHAQLTVSKAEELRWNRKPQDWPLERIEVWWKSANAYRFRVLSPGGAVSEWASDATPDVGGTLIPGGVYHLQLVKWHVDNGDSLLRVEIGDPNQPGGVQAGQWTLEIEAVEILAAPALHAWIARGGGEPSEFEDFVNSDLTLTIPATSDSVIAVAAVEADEQSKLGRFSSRGPTRDGREKPDVAAPGVDVVAALAGTARDTNKMSGTSMAAPHVAGAVALIMSRAIELDRQWPAANQIKSILTQKTKTVTGRHDVGLGFGIVDIAKLLEAVPLAFPPRTRVVT